MQYFMKCYCTFPFYYYHLSLQHVGTAVLCCVLELKPMKALKKCSMCVCILKRKKVVNNMIAQMTGHMIYVFWILNGHVKSVKFTL